MVDFTGYTGPLTSLPGWAFGAGDDTSPAIVAGQCGGGVAGVIGAQLATAVASLDVTKRVTMTAWLTCTGPATPRDEINLWLGDPDEPFLGFSILPPTLVDPAGRLDVGLVDQQGNPETAGTHVITLGQEFVVTTVMDAGVYTIDIDGVNVVTSPAGAPVDPPGGQITLAYVACATAPKITVRKFRVQGTPL